MRSTFKTSTFRRAAMALCSAAGLWSVPAQAGLPNINYAFACQEEFDNLDDVPVAWDSCTAFHTEMDKVGTRLFYYNLTGTMGPRILEEAYDHLYDVEKADVIYVNTHMGAGSFSGAEIAGKSWPTVAAFSKNMALGNEFTGLSILALAGCAAVASYPRPAGDGVKTPYYPVAETFEPRWQRALRGGLRIIVGNWDQFWSHKDHGKWFGYYLRTGYSVEQAWERADSRTVRANDTATASTGRTASECWDRLSNMTLAGIKSGAYPKRAGTQVTHICQHWWTHDSVRDQ